MVDFTDFFKYPVCIFTIIMLGLIIDAGKHLLNQAKNAGKWSMDVKTLPYYLITAIIGGACLIAGVVAVVPPSFEYFLTYVFVTTSYSLVKILNKK